MPTETVQQHVFIIGAKSIGQYGGYETFVDHLIREHEHDLSIQYHVACKANGDGSLDDTKLDGERTSLDAELGAEKEFLYHRAHVFMLRCPKIGPAVAIWYDRAALRYSVKYCKKHRIENPIFYVLTCRIGPFIDRFARQIHELGGTYIVNPDGHEWKRSKWAPPVRAYWKKSESRMVTASDLVICDSVNIERYIKDEYSHASPKTTYIAYGADLKRSALADDEPRFVSWMQSKGLQRQGYYLVVGRFVPENNFETMIREFMDSDTDRVLAIITNSNEKFLDQLESQLHFRSDPRIRFVGTVYDAELLKKIRENAYGYLHGHEVGGTNPSLLEALASTDLNLLLDVGFNREVGRGTALYWNKQRGSLSKLIDEVDRLDSTARKAYGDKARKRIADAYSWEYIGKEYKRALMK